MHAVFSVDPVSPFEAQAEVAHAISGYATRQEQAFAHANCLALLAYTHDPNLQVGSRPAPSIPPEGVTAAPALHREAAGPLL